MAGHKKWSEIRKRAKPETLERAHKKTETFQVAMELNELRQARGLTQEQLAQRLGIRQTNVSRMEQRLDMHVSTLRAVNEALGGKLILTAQFPDTDIRINRFDSTP